MKLDLLELDEMSEAGSCSDWSIRGMQPVGFPLQPFHERLPQTPAATAQDVEQLAVEVAQMRVQFSKTLAQIQQKLSQSTEPRLSSRVRRPTRRGAAQAVLPFVPSELSPILNAVERSKAIVTRQPDPSDDLPLACSEDAWKRAAKILMDHALSVWDKLKVVIRPPVISAGPDGSVDLYWTAAPYGLLVNVPADPKQPATYFGDDTTSPDSTHTSGKLDPTKPINVGVLMWLAHTAEQ